MEPNIPKKHKKRRKLSKMPTTTTIPKSPSSRSTPTVAISQLQQQPNPSFLDVIPALAILISRLDSSAVPPEPGNRLPTIATKDLPSEADDIKIRLHKAHAQILQLPDIDSTIEEQEEVITELDEKIKAQTEVLEKLKARGLVWGG